ncbi:suppressor of fused domain protein [Paroceanicella profunda]|uniref:Suppressor of fused domain protein n=1 Tax=Paroceanicella profunda TaxID=2579971 RepID=A0A5B8FQM7_9RHOB|nr:suppressor of fused domain protein [Paroceanicella profunda]QDL90966.1 suppressor of fused domain protein [Paroceanicella profunda]
MSALRPSLTGSAAALGAAAVLASCSLEAPPARVDTRDIVLSAATARFGPVAAQFAQLVPSDPAIEVLIFAPAPGRPDWTFVTAGMSSLPMADGARAELVISVPEDRYSGPGTRAGSPDDLDPLALLRRLAQAPHLSGAPLAPPQTVDLGRDMPGMSALPMSAVILRPLEGPALDAEVGGTPLSFYRVIPIHDNELALARRAGGYTLLRRLDDAGVPRVVSPGRPPVTP